MAGTRVNEYDKQLGAKIRFFRVLNNKSQNKLAELLGLTKQAVSGIENGKRKVMAFEIVRIADYFNLDIQVFSMAKGVTYQVVDK